MWTFIAAFIGGLALAWYLMDIRRRLINLQLDVQELHADAQEIHALIVDLALEDAGNVEWTFDMAEMNGVGHE